MTDETPARPRRAPSAAVLAAWAVEAASGATLLALAARPPSDAGDALALAAALAALWIVPGALLVDACLPERSATDALERAALALAAGGVTLVLGGWASAAAAGRLSTPILVAGHALVALVLGLVAMARGARGAPRPAGRAAWLGLALVVALAAPVRLARLGYSELQGDEAIVAAKAGALVDGRRDAFLVHKKGPAEILITAQATVARGPAAAAAGAPAAAGARPPAGRIDERAARWPFAWAMLCGLAAFFALGRALFGTRVATVAGLTLGLCGFFVAFARVVQYQSVVFLLSTAALLCTWRLSGAPPLPGGAAGPASPAADARDAAPPAAAAREPGWWLLAAACLAVGILAHYDAALVGPVALGLLIRRWRREPGAWRGDRWAVALGALGALALLGAFFVPLVRHPYFRETTLRYLVEVRLGGGAESAGWWRRLPDNLMRSTALATFYSAIWHGLALALLAGGEIVRRVVGRRAPGAAWATAAAWALVPLVFYFGLVESPRTHFHVAYPGVSLLAALGAVGLWRAAAGRPAARGALALGGAALYAACAWYLGFAFVQHRVEIRRDHPAGRPPGFPLAVSQLPSSGWFGFPYRAGWKAVGALYADGKLQGDYDSNEEPAVTAWYTRGAPRCPEGPRYAFVAQKVQDVQPLLGVEDAAAPGADYVRIGGVRTGGRERITLYERRELHDPAAAPIQVAVEDVAARFDRALSGPRFDAGLAGADPRRWIPNALDADFDGRAHLVGWRLDGARPPAPDAPDGPYRARPGARLILTLVWRAAADLERDWSVFAHVEREGEATAGQSDGMPRPPRETVCGAADRPTSTWRAGEVVEDRRAIALDPAAPPGDYDLLVGLYDYATLERLAVRDAAGGPAGNRVRLAGVRIAP